MKENYLYQVYKGVYVHPWLDGKEYKKEGANTFKWSTLEWKYISIPLSEYEEAQKKYGWDKEEEEA
jgi:hypothetical protein